VVPVLLEIQISGAGVVGYHVVACYARWQGCYAGGRQLVRQERRHAGLPAEIHKFAAF
jgi:hypothetical protein